MSTQFSGCDTCSFAAHASGVPKAGDTTASLAAAVHGGFDENGLSAPWTTMDQRPFARVLSEAQLRRWESAATRPIAEAHRRALKAPPGAYRYMHSRYVPAGTAHLEVGAQTDHWVRKTVPLEWATLAIGATSLLSTASYLIWAQVTAR